MRVNPGLGTGSTKRTNTGGPASSFGIWHEAMGEVAAIGKRHGLHIRRLHSHVGSGTDPEVWKRCARMTLDLVGALPEVATVNLGGGFKVGRMPEEPSVDLADVGAHVRREIEDFRARDGRALHLEIEPGTFLVANAGVIVASCVDVVDTGAEGYVFAKLDAGMPEITRPSLYGAQHPIDVLARGREQAAVVFVGPCCESGDILTPAPGDPEALAPRLGAAAADRRPGGGGRRRRLLRRDGDDQLQLLPAGPRGHARRRRAHPPAPPAGAGAGLAERGLAATRRAPRPRWTARSRWASARGRSR